MIRIPPKERFNQNEKSKIIPPELLNTALRQFGFAPENTSVQRLSGGFMNANFLAQDGNSKIVIRVYSTDRESAEREFDLLKFLHLKSIRVPQALATFEVLSRSVTILEYIDGVAFEQKLLGEGSINPQIYREIGQQLAEIHNIQFKEAGFIGPQLRIGHEYESFSVFIRKFIESTLDRLLMQPERLDLNTNRRMRKLVEDKWELVLKTEPIHQLVHTDFNPKNILVTRGASSEFLGVIDWEFSLSGNGLIDIGNFFRFSYDYAEEAKTCFIAGYRASNPLLPAQWEDVSRLLDLGNMCSFLERPEDYQRSFRTARAVIQATLEHFNY